MITRFNIFESLRDKMTPISGEDFTERLKRTKTDEELRHFMYLTDSLGEFLDNNDMEYTVNFREVSDLGRKKRVVTAFYSIEKSKSLQDHIYPREAHIYVNEYEIRLELWSGQTFDILKPKDLEQLEYLLVEQGFVMNENQ